MRLGTGLRESKQAFECPAPDRLIAPFEQRRDVFAVTIGAVGYHDREHRGIGSIGWRVPRIDDVTAGYALWVEAHQPAAGRHPILTCTRLQEIVNRRMWQPFVRAVVGEGIAVKP